MRREQAGRVEELSGVGSYVEYRIGDHSILVVRESTDSIRAYYNACRHRGTRLASGRGRVGSIICPFHGWRWDLHGNNEFVLERQEFRDGQLRNSDVALKEAHCVVFAGFVWINLSKDPEPFDDFIAPVRKWLEDLAIDQMRNYWWKAIPVPSNWKVAQEAFFETYHVPATHPQLEKAGSEVIYGNRTEAETQFMHRNVEYEVFPHGHGRFYGGRKTPMHGNVQPLNEDPVETMAARLQLLVGAFLAWVIVTTRKLFGRFRKLMARNSGQRLWDPR
jgi:phenylpropionate dioxygenase-like ring-hydroxylating dioxygenase large terminal subunit